MENLTFDETKYTPKITLDVKKGLIEMIGKSYPENTFEFYQPIIDWMKEYFETSAQETTTVNMEIIYFNSSSSKLFFDFFDILEDVHEEHKLDINWIFDEENESAEEAGEDFIEDFENLNIKLVSKQS